MTSVSKHAIVVKTSIDSLTSSEWWAKCSQSYPVGLKRAPNGLDTDAIALELIWNGQILIIYQLWRFGQRMGIKDFCIRTLCASAILFFWCFKPGSKNSIFWDMFQLGEYLDDLQLVQLERVVNPLLRRAWVTCFLMTEEERRYQQYQHFYFFYGTIT